MISFQIDLIPPQYLVSKVFKSSRHSAIVSAGSYIIVMGLLFIFGILAQVGAPPKEVGDTPRSPLDVLHLGHLLKWPARAFQPKLEAQSNLSSSLFRTPEIARTKTDATVAYGLRFGRTLYGWNYNSKTLPMVLVSGPNSSGFDGNHPRKLTSRICPGAASLFLGRWPMYRVGAQYGRVQGVLQDLNPY